jgi:hypothetical protein
MENRYADDNFVNASSVFFGYYYLGDIDKALIWLERSITNREYWLFSPLQYAKYLAPLRQDIRLSGALEKITSIESGLSSR